MKKYVPTIMLSWLRKSEGSVETSGRNASIVLNDLIFGRIYMSHICADLHALVNSQTRYKFPYEAKQIPSDGIYFLFENGEFGHDGDRIVQIGSHNKDGRLRSRLDDHYKKENKDGSILRKHIGRCLLKRANDPYLEVWELDSSSNEYKHRILPDYQQQIEQQVTEYIQTNFSFCVLELQYMEDRSYLKSRISSTVASCKTCNPSPTWLGRSSPLEKIQYWGLWQVNELDKDILSSEDINRMAELF